MFGAWGLGPTVRGLGLGLRVSGGRVEKSPDFLHSGHTRGKGSNRL